MTLCISTRVCPEDLVFRPEELLREMSFKVFARREAFLQSLVATDVMYRSRGGVARGTLVRIDGDRATISRGNGSVVVPLRRVLLDRP